MISKKFRDAVKLDHRKQYVLAWEAHVNPTTLSQILTGYIRPKYDDGRVLRIGQLLGLRPEQCFENVSPNTMDSNQDVAET